MSKIEVDAITEQSGSTLTTGGGAGKTVVVDATTVTLGRCGGTVTLAAGATQSGFGRTGTVDWNTTPKTATFTAVSGDGFFANTSGGAFNMNLPAGVAGAIVSVADYAATWQTNNLTVVPNGTDKIGSVNANATLSTQGQSVTFVYVDSTQGWINTMDSTSNVRANPFIQATGGTITTSGNCKIHTFTGPGTFTVTNIASCAAQNVMSHLVVAGGGSGGCGRLSATCSSGGGGAGGYREVKTPVTPYTASPLDGYPSAPNRITVIAQGYPITVGAGGASAASTVSNNGSPSTFSTITSTGGGGAGSGGASQGPPNTVGNPGGSGGGIGGGCGAGGTGNTPPVTPPQGNNGGSGSGANGFGGGGGATAVGGTGTGPTASRAGGAGATTSITASPVAYAGGGGAGGSANASTGGNASPCSTGGRGGNHPGASPSSPKSGTSGTTNRGGGGGGMGSACTSATSGAGGSGIVIIRYKFQ